jgi:hypothetical protein
MVIISVNIIKTLDFFNYIQKLLNILYLFSEKKLENLIIFLDLLLTKSNKLIRINNIKHLMFY